MPRAYPETHVCHGKAVGFSVKQRDNGPTYFAYFRGPTGQRLERDTNQTGINRARDAARALIEKEYAPRTDPVRKVSWAEAEELFVKAMQAGGERAASIEFYRKVLRPVRAYYAVTDGPADISPSMAKTWKVQYATTKSKKTKKVPSAHTVNSYLGGLSSLWAKWFIEELEICPANPWQDVDEVKADKPTVRWATDEQVADFFKWLSSRFGTWELPAAFFRMKIQTGCRVEDLCSLRSVNVRNGSITFTSDTTKGRKTRTIPVSADLLDALDKLKGKRFVWENYPAQLKAALDAKGWPTHRLKLDFDPSRMAAWVMTIFADYNADRPDAPKLTSHQFRKRAFTLAKLAGIDSRDAATAFGCNPDTMAKHYVGINETDIAANVAKRLAGVLDTTAQPTAQQTPAPTGGKT